MAPSQPPARIGFLLAQLGAHAAQIFAEQLRPVGVTPSEAGVIRILGRTPDLTQRELADRLGALQSRVVALIDGLERKNLVIRTRSTTDRRVQQLRISDAGRAMLGRLRSAAEAQEAAITSGLTDAQQTELRELLQALTALRGLDADVHPGYQEPRGPAGSPRSAHHAG